MASSDPGCRSLRPRSSQPKPETKKRRSFCKDKSFGAEEISVEDVYLQANAKISEFRPSSLETIYESPKGKSHSIKDYMSAVKLKRQCRFSPFYDPPKFKVKMRKTKSKNLKRIGVKVPTGLNITLEQVQKVLNNISEDENEENSKPLPILSSDKPTFGFKINENLHLSENLEMDFKNDLYSLSTSMLEMKVDHDPVSSSNNALIHDKYEGPERGSASICEEELPFDSLDSFSSKANVNKEQKNRRRSGRFQPLRITNKYTKATSPLDVDVTETVTNVPLTQKCFDSYANKEPSLLIPFSNSVEVSSTKTETLNTIDSNPKTCTTSTRASDIQSNAEVCNMFKETVPTPCSSLASKPISRRQQQGVKRKQKERRTSGINRSLYRTILNTPSPDSGSLNASKLSPTTLFGQLNLHSPKFVKQTDTKRGRRKSARLSIGKTQSTLGSLWMENAQTENAILEVKKEEKEALVPSGPLPSAIAMPQQPSDPIDNVPMNVFLEPFSNASSEGRKPTAQSSESSLKPTFQSDLTDCFSGTSPILSGIIDCKARLTQNRKFTVKKDSKICLKSFQL